MDDLLSPAPDNDRLLRPIPGNNPSGEHLRNQPAYDQIKRSVAAASATGGADARKAMVGVVSQASDILAGKSKDIEIAVWLSAALAWTGALPGTLAGLRLLTRLLDRYWDTVYPLMDDGDQGIRSGPLQRICGLLVRPLLAIPVIRGGAYSVQDYLSSRGEGPPSAAEVDRAIESADRQFYEVTLDSVAQCRQQLSALQAVCDKRFEDFDDRPDFQQLFKQFDRVGGIFEAILETKPDSVADLPKPPPSPQAPIKPGSPASVVTSAPPKLAAQPPPMVQKPEATHQPALFPEESVILASATLFDQDRSNPVPYLLIRSLRFGKLMGFGSPVPPERLESPSSELRTALRRARAASDWDGLLHKTEEGMRSPGGATWLDLQFRSYEACCELGLKRPAEAIRGTLVGYIRVLPDLPEATLVDGTPACGPDTLEWLRTEVLPDPQQAKIESLVQSNAALSAGNPDSETANSDAFDDAVAALAAGDFPGAFRILTDAWSIETSGRGKLQRRIQQAQMAVEAGRYRLALPLLREVSRVIEEKRLDNWEPPEWVGHPLAMLCRCLDQLNECPAERQQAYERLCAVDPTRALNMDSL